MCLLFDFQLTWIVFLCSLWPHRHQSANTDALPCILSTENSSPIPYFTYFLWPICSSFFWRRFYFLCECKCFGVFNSLCRCMDQTTTSGSSSNLLPYYQWSVQDVLVIFFSLSNAEETLDFLPLYWNMDPSQWLGYFCLNIVNPDAYIFYFSQSVISQPDHPSAAEPRHSFLLLLFIFFKRH